MTDGHDELQRDIGLAGAVSIGVGTMVAGGIFVLSGLAVATVGAAAILSFVLAAVVAALTAMAYAEFATIYTVDGGGYEYVAEVFQSDLSYVVGWMMILGYPASAAFYLASFTNWFYQFAYPALSIPAAIPYWVSGVVVLAVLVGVNLLGGEESTRFQIVVTGLKVLLVLLFLGGGLTAFDPNTVTDSFARNVTNLDDVALTSALVFITFFGFEAIATSGGEVHNPRRTVPRAIFVSLGFVTALYVLVVTVVVLAVNDPRFLEFLVARTDVESTAAATQFVANHGEVAMGRAAQYYLGEWGFAVFILGALLSMISAANATILAGSRVKLAMADNEHLPGRFGRIHPRFRVPHNAVLLTGGLILTFILVFTVVLGGPAGESAVPWLPHLGLDAIAHFADFMLLGGLAMVNVALIQSRRQYPDRTRLFEVPAVPWVPLVAIASNLLLLANVELVSLSLGVGAVLVGGIVWLTVID